MATEIAVALGELPTVARSTPVFRRVAGIDVWRVHLARIHRHLYYVLAAENEVVVLAVWGAVRRILPQLRDRTRSPR